MRTGLTIVVKKRKEEQKKKKRREGKMETEEDIKEEIKDEKRQQEIEATIEDDQDIVEAEEIIEIEGTDDPQSESADPQSEVRPAPPEKSDGHPKTCCCKRHIKRHATWDDRAVLVSFGVILAAVPASFSAISAHSHAHADVPVIGYVLFAALGMWIVASALNSRLEIEYDEEG
jgi:hypothetical protein